MNSDDIRELQSIRDYPAISIFLPIYHNSPGDLAQTPIRIKNLLRQAEDRLLQEFPKRAVDELQAQLEDLTPGIDNARAASGMALFVSKDVTRIFYLPFPLQERVVIDETFATRDLVSVMNRCPHYRVLVLGREKIRLFEGVCDRLLEVVNEAFPLTREQPGVETEWTGKMPPFAPHGGVDPDQYRTREDRNFFSRVDDALALTLAQGSLPLVVVGVEQNLGLFEEVSKYRDQIIARLTGSFEKLPLSEMEQKVWPLAEEGLTAARNRILSRLDDAIGANKFAGGIQEVWSAAQQGLVDTLLVEEDFYYPARLDENRQIIASDDATSPGVMDDAVDDLMETVLRKSGQVFFVDTGALQQRERIAAILRY